jgi:hypothetical protein
MRGSTPLQVQDFPECCSRTNPNQYDFSENVDNIHFH